MHEDRTPEEAADALGYWSLSMDICGYDPRFLLTDQRNILRRQADILLAEYRETYPQMAGLWDDLMPRDNTMLELMPFSEEIGSPLYPSRTGRAPSVGPDFVYPKGRVSFPNFGRPDQVLDKVVYVIDYKSIEDRFGWAEMGTEMHRRIAEQIATARDKQLEFYRAAMFGEPVDLMRHRESTFALFTRDTVVPEEPKKQNGRSAAYLRHDKSKSNINKRRKRK